MYIVQIESCSEISKEGETVTNTATLRGNLIKVAEAAVNQPLIILNSFKTDSDILDV